MQTGTEPQSIVKVNFTTEDVLEMAEQAGVDSEVALERARDWGESIQDTVMQIAGEQLASVIETNQP